MRNGERSAHVEGTELCFPASRPAQGGGQLPSRLCQTPAAQSPCAACPATCASHSSPHLQLEGGKRLQDVQRVGQLLGAARLLLLACEAWQRRQEGQQSAHTPINRADQTSLEHRASCCRASTAAATRPTQYTRASCIIIDCGKPHPSWQPCPCPCPCPCRRPAATHLPPPHPSSAAAMKEEQRRARRSSEAT